MEKKITRIYTGPDGESHFEDVKVPLEAEVRTGQQSSEPIKVRAVHFLKNDSGYKHGWHNAPRRQFVVTLEGMGEIEIGDGTKRQFGPGDILLAEDTTGRGHISRVVSNQPRKMMVVVLD